MPSSLLLMSGTLPTEVFKILPVVHSRVWRVGGVGGHACKNDGQQLVKENITIDNKGQSELTNSSITVSRFPGGRAASQRIRVHESI